MQVTENYFLHGLRTTHTFLFIGLSKKSKCSTSQDLVWFLSECSWIGLGTKIEAMVSRCKSDTEGDFFHQRKMCFFNPSEDSNQHWPSMFLMIYLSWKLSGPAPLILFWRTLLSL